jgi:hypothetical protein
VTLWIGNQVEIVCEQRRSIAPAIVLREIESAERLRWREPRPYRPLSLRLGWPPAVVEQTYADFRCFSFAEPIGSSVREIYPPSLLVAGVVTDKKPWFLCPTGGVITPASRPVRGEPKAPSLGGSGRGALARLLRNRWKRRTATFRRSAAWAASAMTAADVAERRTS